MSDKYSLIESLVIQTTIRASQVVNLQYKFSIWCNLINLVHAFLYVQDDNLYFHDLSQLTPFQNSDTTETTSPHLNLSSNLYRAVSVDYPEYLQCIPSKKTQIHYTPREHISPNIPKQITRTHANAFIKVQPHQARR